MRIYIHDNEHQNWNVFTASTSPFCLFSSAIYHDPARPRCMRRTASVYPRLAFSLNVDGQAAEPLTPLIFLMFSLLISSCVFAEEAPQAETRQSRS